MGVLAPFFIGAYLGSVFGLTWFNLDVLGLGDPKFKEAVDVYFPLWSVAYAPAVVIALVFLWRSRQKGWALWRLASFYLALILLALEISFVLDLNWIVLLVELAGLGFLFHKCERKYEQQAR